MNQRLREFHVLIAGLCCLTLAACTSSEKLVTEGFQPSAADASQIVHSIPNYRQNLQSIKGKGRAIVSEPGNTERVTVLFSSNRTKSLVTVRNGIGIEGGQMLSDGDTLLVFNKIDKYARKIPIRGGNLSRINRLASLNILDMISYSVSGDDVETVLENEELYQLQLTEGTNILVDKKSGMIRRVEQPKSSELPYSEITYDAYSSIEGFTLPRRISIFGAERESKVALQLTGLELNPTLDSLTINLPDDTRIYYQ